MANPALTEALTQIANAANAALAALADDDATETVAAEPATDWHANDLERIEAEAAAAATVIEAQAAATVAVIEAEAAASTTDDDDGADLDDLLDLDLDTDLDGAELLGNDDDPPADITDIADAGAAVDTAVEVLDALPTLDPVKVDIDFPPAPMHWYTRPLFARR